MEGSKQVITGFTAGANPLFTVEYTSAGNFYSMGSNEKPDPSFFSAIYNVEDSAAEYFGFNDADIYKLDIEKVSWNDKDVSVRFELANKDSKVSGIKLSKNGLSTRPETDKNGDPVPGSLRNDLIQALDIFRTKCAGYVHGEREQKEFNFPEQEADA